MKIHSIVGSGANSGSQDTANILKITKNL